MTEHIIEGIGITIGVVIAIKIYGTVKYVQGYHDGKEARA